MFSLNFTPAIDCHRLNSLWHYRPHCSYTFSILAKKTCHCSHLKTNCNSAERHFDSIFSIHTIRQYKAFNMHSPDSLCPECATVFYKSLSSAIHVSVIGSIVGMIFFSPFLTLIFFFSQPVFLLIHRLFFFKVLDLCISSYLVSIFFILISCSVLYLLCMVY